MTTIATTQDRKSILLSMAGKFGMEPAAFEATVRKTCGCDGASKEEFAAFLLVANEYGLNPITKEIYAFPKKGGGVQPIVGVDGWFTMANNHPAFDGITFEDRLSDDGQLLAVTARVHRKDRSHPIEVTEYMAECRRDGGDTPWKKWPARMLRHKSAIQAIRYAFGFSGIVDPDEADRMRPAVNVTVNHHAEPVQHRRFAKALPAPVVEPEDTDVEHFDAGEIDAEAHAHG